jgi:hypothetical protein
LGALILAMPLARAVSTVYDCPVGGFAFKVPAGWVIKQERIEEFPSVFGPEDDDRAPYLVITEVQGGEDMFTLGDGTVKEMLKDPMNHLSARDSFYTADQRIGLKYVFTTVASNGPYRQVFYIVEGPGDRRFAFLATVPEAGWEKYQPFLDNIMKTYHQRAGAPPPDEPVVGPPPSWGGNDFDASAASNTTPSTTQSPARAPGK